MAEYCVTDATEKFYKKVKEEALEKLECEEMDAFLHEHLKKIQYFWNDFSRLFLCSI